ncbi:prephenate dehydrogenase/arogenate dehydrogenase family protein [Ktedonosporobacter rubrisoli]|uniref:Prephenate dehydrogenase/arogenate dehydrogenase family protein n=1 Tax=Ktedonosporobacter rubrisoli TaxID=2509675 RepID=A0A4P6JSL3_KTERU|nr:prephenate dehydrogenase/arogenate dehydrogenase family protein [Ktedonosporobacter rubrisoli]QBD78240.1 prephenate dehydrogenase/arogenate dehydrogenase family protein [Ktedonosporobacter rubrisoli]
MFSRVAIIGLGLIGGSMGLALRKAKAAQQVVGYDLGRGVSDRARKIGAIEQHYHSLADTVRGAELVILATPVGAMKALLQNLSDLLSPGAVVTDVASTKVQVISWAEEFLPSSVSFVGGHPMSGKELSGVEAADAELFSNYIYCLTPTARTRPTAVSKVSSMVESLGARVRFLEPAEHDGQVAGVSHLPFIASAALVNTAAESASWGDASLLAANGFRDISRLAAGNPIMYRDICLTNSEAIVRWIDGYIATLRDMREHIATHDRDIEETFAQAQHVRLKWQEEQSIKE